MNETERLHLLANDGEYQLLGNRKLPEFSYSDLEYRKSKPGSWEPEPGNSKMEAEARKWSQGDRKLSPKWSAPGRNLQDPATFDTVCCQACGGSGLNILIDTR